MPPRALRKCNLIKGAHALAAGLQPCFLEEPYQAARQRSCWLTEEEICSVLDVLPKLSDPTAADAYKLRRQKPPRGFDVDDCPSDVPAFEAGNRFANRQVMSHWARESFSQALGMPIERLGMDTVYDVLAALAKSRTVVVEYV